jgi:pimeloyl-ACP methyl ester carboxylesterase
MWVVALALTLLPVPACAQEFTTETVTWRTGEVFLEGTLYLPRTAGPHPGSVFIHGSGTLLRSARIFREHAERLSGAGLAVLIYDKRGTGSSTGDWRNATLADLAEDALGAIELLRQDSRIDPARIGFVGASQGGWIALLAAARDVPMAFMVTLSSPTTTPAEQGHFVVEAAMRKKGYPDADIREALALDRRIVEVYRTDSGWEEARAAVDNARSRPWFADAGVGIQPRDSWNWRWYRDLPFDLDPLPLLESLRCPLLATYGEIDALVPSSAAAATVDSFRVQGKDFTSRVFSRVGHILYTETGAPSRSWSAPEEYWATLVDWLRRKSILN